MKTSFHQSATAFREKSHGNGRSLLNSRGYRPVGKRDRARKRAEEAMLREGVAGQPEGGSSRRPAVSGQPDGGTGPSPADGRKPEAGGSK